MFQLESRNHDRRPLRSLHCILALAAVVLAGVPGAQAQDDPPDGHFDWPLGGQEDDRIAGENIYVQQNFANLDGPVVGTVYTCGRAHAGVDLQIDVGLSADAPVYAAADGRVRCICADCNYPGKVVVIEHQLPDGDLIYSVYAHLTECDEGTAGCVDDEEDVRRGVQIGTILDQANTDNDHLHFEIRDFPGWYDGHPLYGDPANNIANCPGRGYAEEDGLGTPEPRNGLPNNLDPGYLNPIDFILSHRPPPPEELGRPDVTVRVLPADDAEEITNLQEIRPVAVVRDERYICDDTETSADSYCDPGRCPDLDHQTTGVDNNRLVECTTRAGNDCTEGACNWWYEVEATPAGGGAAVTGYVKIIYKQEYHSHVLLGEPVQDEGVGPWQEQEEEPLVWFRFLDQDLEDGQFLNLGTQEGLNGLLTGEALSIEIPLGDETEQTLALDGAMSHVEVEGSAALTSPETFAFSLWVFRRANDDEDVVVGQWDADDVQRQRWLVSFFSESPDGVQHQGGELRFLVRWGDAEDEVHTLRYVLPDCEYLEDWIRISGSYDPTDGIRLYWNNRQVAHVEDISGQEIVTPAVPLRIGAYASAPDNDLTRLDGGVYNFQLWAESPQFAVTPTDTVLIIDSSGSMGGPYGNDPKGQRKNAANVFFQVSPDDDYVGVVDFDWWVREENTSDELLRLGDEGSIETLSGLVSGIDSSGSTYIGRGVERACLLLEQETGNEIKAGILLTDGHGPCYPNQKACFSEENWSLWAIGFGDASQPGLEGIVRSGPDDRPEERVTVVDTPEAALCEIQQVRARLIDGNTVPCTEHLVQPGGQVYQTVNVSSDCGSLSCYTAWSGSDVVMTLISPSGRIIGRDTTAPDVEHLLGPIFEVYTVDAPEPGLWSIQLYGAEVPSGGERVTFGASLLARGDPSGNRPPDVSAAVPSVPMIWPPNHKMVDVEILGVTDPEGGPVTITVTGITQDEPVQSRGQGKAADAEGVGTGTASLRAERHGEGNGRVYEISFRATDDRGASASGSVQVCVPHDQRDEPSCIDDGQVYDSTAA